MLIYHATQKSFKKLFFVLIVFSFLVIFLNSSSESITKTNVTLPDYMFTIRYFINNFKHLLLLLSGDIEINPGPKRSSNIKFCHWNINGLAAHDFIKVPLVEAFITSNNFDLVCLSETFLDSTIPNDDVNIQINGYSLLRADNPNDIKRGGVCIYFKESLPLIRRNDLTNIKDCLVTEIDVSNKKCFFTCLYRLPSQSHEELERFCTNFDLLLSNINNIDLIFSSNVNIMVVVEQSLYKTCHHNIIYGTLNFDIPLPLLILGKYGIIKMQILDVSKS